MTYTPDMLGRKQKQQQQKIRPVRYIVKLQRKLRERVDEINLKISSM